jgi:hypothetical protein
MIKISILKEIKEIASIKQFKQWLRVRLQLLTALEPSIMKI